MPEKPEGRTETDAAESPKVSVTPEPDNNAELSDEELGKVSGGIAEVEFERKSPAFDGGL